MTHDDFQNLYAVTDFSDPIDAERYFSILSCRIDSMQTMLDMMAELIMAHTEKPQTLPTTETICEKTVKEYMEKWCKENCHNYSFPPPASRAESMQLSAVREVLTGGVPPDVRELLSAYLDNTEGVIVPGVDYYCTSQGGPCAGKFLDSTGRCLRKSLRCVFSAPKEDCDTKGNAV